MLVKPICKFDFKIDIVKQNKTSFSKTDLEPQIDLSFGSTETPNNTVSDKMVAH